MSISFTKASSELTGALNKAKGVTSTVSSEERIAEKLLRRQVRSQISKSNPRRNFRTRRPVDPDKLPGLKPNIQLFGEKAENVAVKGADAINKAPYDPRAMEQLIKSSGDDVISYTLPRPTAKNGNLAGVRHPKTGIVFDQRGFSIFEDIAKVEVRITGDLGNMLPDAYMRAATRQLRAEIESGRINKSLFTEDEWLHIKGGRERIGEYTWHHQDTGRMQLVPGQIHKDRGHLGGNKLWGIQE